MPDYPLSSILNTYTLSKIIFVLQTHAVIFVIKFRNDFFVYHVIMRGHKCHVIQGCSENKNKTYVPCGLVESLYFKIGQIFGK